MKTNTKVPKTPFFAAFSVGAVLFSAHAGGGFATGNQANTYYVGLGWTGIISAIAAMLLLTLTMREAMIMYNSRGLTSYKQLFETLYHPFDKIEWAFEVFFYIMVLMAVAAAISGAARIMGHVCPPTLMQKVIELCAGERPDLAAYEENRNLLYNSLREMGYQCAKPDGAK